MNFMGDILDVMQEYRFFRPYIEIHKKIKKRPYVFAGSDLGCGAICLQGGMMGCWDCRR
jgi:hypothetical protein